MSRSRRPEADVDYLFVQVVVDEARVDDAQNCGNLLAGVGPFAIEQGLVAATPGTTRCASAWSTPKPGEAAIRRRPDGRVTYEGDARIDGVPGTAAPILLDFAGHRGLELRRAACLPGRGRDRRRGGDLHRQRHARRVLPAATLGGPVTCRPRRTRRRYELDRRMESIRRTQAGLAMGLGDVTKKCAEDDAGGPAARGGTRASRTFIPHVATTRSGCWARWASAPEALLVVSAHAADSSSGAPRAPSRFTQSAARA